MLFYLRKFNFFQATQTFFKSPLVALQWGYKLQLVLVASICEFIALVPIAMLLMMKFL